MIIVMFVYFELYFFWVELMVKWIDLIGCFLVCFCIFKGVEKFENFKEFLELFDDLLYLDYFVGSGIVYSCFFWFYEYDYDGWCLVYEVEFCWCVFCDVMDLYGDYYEIGMNWLMEILCIWFCVYWEYEYGELLNDGNLWDEVVNFFDFFVFLVVMWVCKQYLE